MSIQSFHTLFCTTGLPKDVARGLATQTALGAGKMAVTSEHEPKELRLQVTSPNGTTEAAMKMLESAGIRKIYAQVCQHASDFDGYVFPTLVA